MRLAPRWWSPPMWTWAPTVGTLSVKVSSNQVSVRKYLSPCVLALLLTRVCGSSPIPDMPPARQGDTPVAHRGGGRFGIPLTAAGPCQGWGTGCCRPLTGIGPA